MGRPRKIVQDPAPEIEESIDSAESYIAEKKKELIYREEHLALAEQDYSARLIKLEQQEQELVKMQSIVDEKINCIKDQEGKKLDKVKGVRVRSVSPRGFWAIQRKFTPVWTNIALSDITPKDLFELREEKVNLVTEDVLF